MPPAPSKPITAAEFYDTLLDTDRIVATRTAANQPDIAKRVGLLPPVALVDYLASRLYRGGNNAGVPVKVVDFYDPTEPGFDPLKHSALTTLDPAFLCLKTRCIIVNPRPPQAGEYTLEYTTFSATTFRVWRDGRFSQSGQQSDALWYAVKSPEAAAPEWASLQSNPPTASYNFPIKYLLRHPFAGNQLFFETKVAGVLPAPSAELGDANYLRVAREAVPVPQPGGASLWRPGVAIAAGEFKFNSAAPPVLFYAKQPIGNPQAEPFLAGSTAQANALYEQVGGAGGGSAYVLPQASPTVLGGVKGAGAGLSGNASVNADGSLSVPTGATAWVAGEPIAAGQLKFNSAAVLFYAKAAIANPAAQPFVFGSSVATNDLYAHAHSGAPEWNFNTYYRRGQIVEVPFPGGALYVCNETHTGGSSTDPVGNLFTQALTSRWNLVSRQANTVETVIAGGGNTNNLRPAALSLETFRTPATGTVTLGTATDASGRTKPGEGYTLVITQSRAGGITFDPVSFANQPRLSGAGGTDILRFYTDAAGKLYCWSDGQGLVGVSAAPAPAADTSSCIVQVGDINTDGGPDWAVLTASTYQAVPMTAVMDPGNNWNAANRRYTVPATGRYEVQIEMLRFDKLLPAGNEFYFGGATTVGAEPQMLWKRTTGSFNGEQHVYRPTLTAGQFLYLTIFPNGFSGKVAARLAIRRLAS